MICSLSNPYFPILLVSIEIMFYLLKSLSNLILQWALLWSCDSLQLLHVSNLGHIIGCQWVLLKQDMPLVNIKSFDKSSMLTIWGA